MFTSAESLTHDFENSLPSAPPLRTQPDTSVMCRVLDEIDYGLILVSPDGRVQHANHLGRYELARGKLLTAAARVDLDGAVIGLVKDQLHTHDAAETAELLSGIRAAARGRRHMLTLRRSTESLTLACVPLSQPFEGACASVLLMLARRTETAN